jgi:hypothetical protein
MSYACPKIILLPGPLTFKDIFEKQFTILKNSFSFEFPINKDNIIKYLI